MLQSKSSASISPSENFGLNITSLVNDTKQVISLNRTSTKRVKSAGKICTVPLNLRREYDKRRISNSAHSRINYGRNSIEIENEIAGDFDTGLNSEMCSQSLEIPLGNEVESSSEYIPAQMSIRNLPTVKLNNTLTERDLAALKLGRLVLTSVFDRQDKTRTTADEISRFFFDAWLAKNGSSLGKADSLSIELMATLQKTKAKIAMHREAANSANYDNTQFVEGVQCQEIACGIAFGALDYIVKEFGAANPVLREIRDIIAPVIFMEPPTFEESMQLCSNDMDEEDNISVSSGVVFKEANVNRLQALGQQYSNKKTWFGDMAIVQDQALEAESKLEDAMIVIDNLNRSLQLAKKEMESQRFEYEQKILAIHEGGNSAVNQLADAKKVIEQHEEQMRKLQLALMHESKCLIDSKANESFLKSKLDNFKDLQMLAEAILKGEIKELEEKIAVNAAQKKEDDETIKKLSKEISEKDEILEIQNQIRANHQAKLLQNRANDPPFVSLVGSKSKNYVDYLEHTEGFLLESYIKNTATINTLTKELESKTIAWNNREKAMNLEIDTLTNDLTNLKIQKEKEMSELRASMFTKQQELVACMDKYTKLKVKNDDDNVKWKLERAEFQSRIESLETECGLLKDNVKG